MSLSQRFSDAQLAVMALVDAGASKEDAQNAVLADPSITGRLFEQIAAKRAEFDAQEREAEEQAFAATPEGRREAAFQAQAEREERAKTVEAAKVLYQEQFGFQPEGLSDADVLHATGIERDFSKLSIRERDQAVEEFAASLPQMDADARLERARALGVDITTVENYARNFNGSSFTPTFGGEGGEGGEGQ